MKTEDISFKHDSSLHHVLYEITEYLITFPQLEITPQSSLPQLISNMYWEHMAMHARNLIEFFTGTDKKDNIKRKWFKYERTTTVYERVSDLHKRVSHLSAKRTKDFDWKECISEVELKLLPEIQQFLKHLLDYCNDRMGYYQCEECKEIIAEYIPKIKDLLEMSENHHLGITFKYNISIE